MGGKVSMGKVIGKELRNSPSGKCLEQGRVQVGPMGVAREWCPRAHLFL